MPKNKSNFSRYKIPDDLAPLGICCISVPVPDDPEWLAQFMGAIWRMSLQTHYERDDAHSAITVAGKWREIWEEVNMAGCCDGVADGSNNITLINIQNQLLIQQWNETWIAAGLVITAVFPSTPDFYDSDPGDAGPEVAQRNRALCLAVNSWVDELFNRGLQLAEEAGLSIAAGIGAGIVIPFVPAYMVLGGFVAAAFALAELVQELSRSAYRDYVKCGMYDAMIGVSTASPTGFAESWDNLPPRPPPPENAAQDIARDVIEAWARSQLNNTDNYLGFIQTLNLAMGIASSLTDEDCQCTATWEHEFDFTVASGGWVTDPQDGSGWGAGWTVGIGWVNTGGSSQRSLAIKYTILAKDANFTQVKMSYILANSLAIRARIQTVLVIDTDSAQIAPENTFVTFAGFLDIATQTLHCLIQSNGTNQSHTLEKVTFKGTGVNPFL